MDDGGGLSGRRSADLGGTASIRTTPPRPRDLKAPVAALLLLALIWGYAWVVMKIALRYCDPWTFSALRSSLGAGALLLLLPLSGRSLRPRAVGPTVVLGLLQTTAFVGLMTWALSSGGAGRTSILTYTMPFWLLVLARVFLREKIRGLQWAAVGLALGGLLMILSPWELQGGRSSLLALGGAIFWAASAVYAKVLRKKHQVDLLSLTAWQLLFGAIPLALAAIFAGGHAPEWTGTFIAALVFVALLGNALAWVLWLYILSSFRAGTAGLATLLTPVIGIISAWVQLGERPGLLEGLGMIAIVSALLLTALQELIRGRRSP
jgi:drug/metabolite transporter (DMT)-like permease